LKRYLTRDRKKAAPSPDDLAEKECVDAAVQEAAKMLAPMRLRTIASLTKTEMSSIMWAGISAWIVKRSELESALGDSLDQALNDPIEDLWR
jgi:hypothetical protein